FKIYFCRSRFTPRDHLNHELQAFFVTIKPQVGPETQPCFACKAVACFKAISFSNTTAFG
ncbi:MAG TPA: hypothetical protein VIJ27_02135, partial [Mucilaginibacter sp.]